jgi:polyisoprenoid-binding protein YceI
MSASDYTIDPGVSRFTALGVAGGMLSALGHDPIIGIRDLAGDVRFDADAPERSWLRMRIPAACLEVQNQASEKDRREMKRTMDREVLETARYPDIDFESTGVRVTHGDAHSPRVELEGNLTLHGVTRPLRFPARVSVLGDMLRANGEFSVLLSDYRMKRPSVAGGTLKLKDQIKLVFDIAARQKTGSVLAAGGGGHVPGDSG